MSIGTITKKGGLILVEVIKILTKVTVSAVTAVNNLMETINIKFDIIIDDGWHWDEAQKKTLSNFFPYLKDGGIHVIEDIYPNSNITATPCEIKNIIGNNEHFFVGLKNNQCVIRKKQINATGFC